MKPLRGRVVLFSILILCVFAAMLAKLGYMQTVQADAYQARADASSTKTIIETGKRGAIYDCNMVALAYDRDCYDVQFYRDPSKSSAADRAKYTNSIIAAIELIESNGKSTVTDFWLKKNDEGVWEFDTGTTSEAVATTRISQWRSNFMLATEPVEKLFDALCANYSIPETLTEEQKVKVLAIWQASRMSNFTSSPVTIAYDVDFQTISEIEARSSELIGFSVLESSTRVYPLKNIASHAVGYTSKITNDLESYQEKGYPNDARVGAAGMEASMEDQLSPYIEYRQGQKVVEIDTKGKAVRELSYEAPTDGNSIVLTIDTQLQERVQYYLERNINYIRNMQETDILQRETWQRSNRTTLNEYIAEGKEIQLAQTGAMVVMDPYSGRVLALASYPDYDLSLFEDVIDAGSWSEIIYDERSPMFNRAIGARDTPGSIFKLVTALGSLSEGNLTLDRRITDAGEYTGTDTVHNPKCWISEANRYLHADQTVVEALTNSCNFFFYTVGEELGSANITKWAAALGLTSRTNIELPGESTSFVGNQSVLYDSSRTISNQYTFKPIIAANVIRAKIYEIGARRGVEYDSDVVEAAVKSILDIVELNGLKTDVWPPAIRDVLMYDLGMPREYISQNYLVNEFFTYINDLKWTSNETIMAAIGQSITQVTPVAVARYVSAIVNGGTVYDAQIIDKIIASDGSVVLDKQPSVANQIETDPAYFQAIREGMKNVGSGENESTAGQVLGASKYAIAAKTGTSQRTDLDVENNSWMVAFAPADDPKVVVACYIQNGYAGAQASRAIRYVIEYYLDNLYNEESKSAQTDYTLAE